MVSEGMTYIVYPLRIKCCHDGQNKNKITYMFLWIKDQL